MSQAVISLSSVGVSYKMSAGLFATKCFSALEDISLDVLSGETLGVIGANGSGKSTLLKVLARIYQPDTGSMRCEVDRVSLLSLTLGFDPQLSGYDNAILSSMLLGASLGDAKKKLPRIIEFSELGELAGNPIKTYSSGMRARLGFSIALFMKSDVLLIDETLSVGDAHFQLKSEQAIMDRISSSQTVVLVSHSSPLIQRVCNRVIWLHQGRIRKLGKPDEVINAYLRATAAQQEPTTPL